MAFELKSLSLSFLLLMLCLLLLLQLSADGFNGPEKNLNNGISIKEISNRKLLEMNVLKVKETAMKSKSKKEEEEGWELRTAPSGPDPLHHHGSDPKKPRTP